MEYWPLFIMRRNRTTLSTQIRQTLTGKKSENYNPTHLGLPNLNRHCFFRNRRWSIYLRYLEGQRLVRLNHYQLESADLLSLCRATAEQAAL